MRYERNLTSGDNPLDDIFHGFFAGHYSRILAGVAHDPKDSAKRVIRPLYFDFFGIPPDKRKLPEVKIISSFVLRRQFYRELNPCTFSKLLKEALVGL
jgi:hypothetical protein